ncbi:MAG: branched-chain-amino-acid transaminase [Desulfotomaculaceae bacterium]|nr:branched-chain-amino-acid transaminase [Desulfotomaculaceae bacterium]
MIIYLNGEFVPKERAVVSVFDHGLLYGDGVFEGIRAYHGRVFKLGEHLDRLYEGARVLCLEIPVSKEEMQEIVLETLRRNNLSDAYIRLVVTRGPGDLGLDPRKCPKAFLFCIAATIVLYPDEMYQKGMSIISVSTRRNIPTACIPRVKSLNYLNNIYAKMEASLAGMPEAIMLNNEGYVAEATGDNIFIVKNGVLITPPSSAGILEGITRNSVMDIAREKGIAVAEELFTMFDVYTAEEVFLTGTAAEVIPCINVDGRIIGSGMPGEMTRKLITAFKELTKVDGPLIYPSGGE